MREKILKKQRDTSNAAPVSAAFIAVKINDVEHRIKESRAALLRDLEKEVDKRDHISNEFSGPFKINVEQSTGRKSHRRLEVTKSNLHRQSGFLNKFKDV